MPRRLLLIGLGIALSAAAARAAETGPQAVDRFVAAVWARDKVVPAGPADELHTTRFRRRIRGLISASRSVCSRMRSSPW